VVEQTTGANLTDAKWHHVAYAYDQTSGGFVSFYVDGVLDTTRTNSRPWGWESDLPLEIGKSHNSWWSAYTGFLDEFRIYNRVLAASEIAGLAGIGPQVQIIINANGQPRDLTLGASDTASFNITATVLNGSPTNLTYQWQKDGVDIPGATSATFSLTAATGDSGKKFRCVVSHPGAANVTSREATLTVLPEFVVHLDFASVPAGDVVADTAPDSVRHDGTNLGAIWVANETGRTGVMSFDGAMPSQITISAAPDLNSMRGTIAFWMKSAKTTPTPNPYAMLFDRRAMPADGVPLTGGEVLFQLPDGHVSNQAEVAGRARANEFNTASNLTDNKWHHVAYVYDQAAKGYVSYYVDGRLDGTKANSRSWYWVPEQIIELGASHDPWWSAYTGFIDDFRIYNRVLSSTEIAALAGVLPPQLSISRNGNQVTLTWDTGTLLSSSTVNGPYTDLTTATSPYSVTPIPGQQQFYRVRR
jgi:hypothetical protein